MMFAFAFNARDTIASSPNRDSHAVEAELASMLYHVDGDENDTAEEG